MIILKCIIALLETSLSKTSDVPDILQGWGEPQNNTLILFIQWTEFKVIPLLQPLNAMSSLISLILQTAPVRRSLREWFSPSTWGQDSYDSAIGFLGSYRENCILCPRLPELKGLIKIGSVAGQFWQILSPNYNHHYVLYPDLGQGPHTWATHSGRCLTSLFLRKYKYHAWIDSFVSQESGKNDNLTKIQAPEWYFHHLILD